MRIVNTSKARENITIEFTPKEQDAIFSVTQKVGGPPTGRRGVLTDLGVLLREHGAADNYSMYDLNVTGRIDFKDQ
jgi:hypothetical protein